MTSPYLKGLLPQGSLGGETEEVGDWALESLLHPVTDEENSLGCKVIGKRAWSTLIGRGMSRLCSNWLDLDHSVCQLPYAIKTQLKARIVFLAVSLWHKSGFHAQKESMIGGGVGTSRRL